MRLNIKLKGVEKLKSFTAADVRREFVTTANRILAVIEANVVKTAPKRRGTLRQSIHIDRMRETKLVGSVGTGSPYAWQRERGGPIVPKGQALHWIEGGQPIWIRGAVRQKGTNWFKRGVDFSKGSIQKLLIEFFKRVSRKHGFT